MYFSECLVYALNSSLLCTATRIITGEISVSIVVVDYYLLQIDLLFQI